jgi:preprotein translocase subunit SecF
VRSGKVPTSVVGHRIGSPSNFTAVVAVVDAVVGGAAVALVVGIAFGTSLAVAVVIGAAAAVLAVGAAMRFQHTRRDAGTMHPVLFPSDAP